MSDRFWLLLVCLLGAAVMPVAGVTKNAVAKPKRVTSDPLLRQLTLNDRIAQMIMVRGYGDYPPDSNAEYRRFLDHIRREHVGGFIVAGRIRNGNVILAQPHEMVAFVNRMQKLARVPLLVGSDFERGASMRVAVSARFPHLMAFAAAHDSSALKELGAVTAKEARALGVQWVFAPDADVNINPDNPIINTRSLGEDPAAVASGVSDFIIGAHRDPSNAVLVTAKHFPGHGDTAEDSHIQMARLTQSRERLESVELVPFRAAIKSGVDAVMTAHMAVPSLDGEDRPSTLSPNVLTGVLRNELGFDGLIVTDALEMQGISGRYGAGESAVLAVEAGADVLLMPTDPTACIRAISKAVAGGRISRERIDRSVSKILAAKRRVGLMRSRTVNLDNLSDTLDAVHGDVLAQSIADRAVTLVRDNGHLFPMVNDGRASCLVVLGESQWTTRGEALATELRREMKNLRVYLTTSYVPDPVLASIAADTATCPAIYVAAFVTVSANRGSVALEGGLPKFLQTMIQQAVPVALISFGSPYLLRDFPNVTAYASTFSTTATSEIAAARAMLGKFAISGRMPVSIPGFARIGDGMDVPPRPGAASSN